jgi:hypothetical protein
VPSKIVFSQSHTTELVSWDAAALVKMASNGIFDFSQPQNLYIGGSAVDFVPIKSELVGHISGIYSFNSYATRSIDDKDANINFGSMLNLARAYSDIEEATLEKIGSLLFGKPTVYTAEEKKLKLPKSITSNSDVLWIEFPITVTLNRSDIDLVEMYIELSLPDGCIAREIFPLSLVLMKR